ncbi:MAG TPA: hypothetical protein PKY31_09660 [Spirochaetota bacterium]|nr:hypothetical protein [Spirochaetota bacterium]
MIRQITGILFLISFTTAALGAGGLVERRGPGIISWDKGIVSATADSRAVISPRGTPTDSYNGARVTLNRARMDSFREARDAALERLVNAVRSLRIDAEKTVGDAIEEHDITQARLSEALMHSAKVREKPTGHLGSSAEATLSFGDIIAALPYVFPGNDFPSRDDAKIRTDYTGLVIDGRGLSMVPMLFPSVFNEHGLEIYGRPFVSGRHAGTTGMAAYCRNEDEAMKHRKAGSRPYYAVAVRSLRGCPVISDRDARRILSSPFTTERLKKCGVIIILDAKNGGS